MKILTVNLGMDLRLREGCTPVWWQLYKALYEEDAEIVNIPLRGDPIEALWWKSTASPCKTLIDLGSASLNVFRKTSRVYKTQSVSQNNVFSLPSEFIGRFIEKKILEQLDSEKNVDCILFMSINLKLIAKMVTRIRRCFSIPILFYEGDMPEALPRYSQFSPYSNSDLSVFDAFITNSKGVEKELKQLGASKVFTIYYAADPDLYHPVRTEKDIDVFFFGYGSNERKHWVDAMLNNPSLVMKRVRFAVGGKMDVVSAVRNLGDIPFTLYRKTCCRSRLCLNIPRPSFAEVYGSSNVRPFELAALGQCFVMSPSLGIKEWFEPKKEVVVPVDEEEVVEIYRWLLNTPEERIRIGKRAQERLLREHTYRHRAKQLLEIIKSLI